MTSKTSQPNSQIATPPDGRALHDCPGHHLVIGIALTVARSGGSLEGPEQADDRHPAAGRSALWTRVVFPEPSRAEFEEVIVDQAHPGDDRQAIHALRAYQHRRGGTMRQQRFICGSCPAQAADTGRWDA